MRKRNYACERSQTHADPSACARARRYKCTRARACSIIYAHAIHANKNGLDSLPKGVKNEQRSKDAAANKRPNTNGVGKINNYYEYIYIPPYNNTD